jgi:hypothetical protein
MTHITFDCREITADRYAATPQLVLRLRLREHTGTRVHALALRCQISIQPQARDYSTGEKELLRDLFGAAERWQHTLRPLHLSTLSITVPGFTDTHDIDVPLPVTYDIEVAWAHYLDVLCDGELPLLLMFSGTVFTTHDGGFGIHQLPWSSECSHRMPVTVWRALMDAHFPDATWLRLDRGLRHELARYKADAALPTFDAALRALLAHAGRSAP